MPSNCMLLGILLATAASVSHTNTTRSFLVPKECESSAGSDSIACSFLAGLSDYLEVTFKDLIFRAIMRRICTFQILMDVTDVIEELAFHESGDISADEDYARLMERCSTLGVILDISANTTEKAISELAVKILERVVAAVNSQVDVNRF